GQPAGGLKKNPRVLSPHGKILSQSSLMNYFPPSRTTSLRNGISIFEQKSLNTFYNALNHTDQDSLNAAVGGNFLERSTHDVLMIIENKLNVRNSRSKSIASQVKACNTNSCSEMAKLTHAVNEQTNAVTMAMTAMLRQFQATQPPAPVKVVEETYVTCGGAHPYYQCLAVGGKTFPEFRDNIQEYVSAATANYNHGNPGYRPQEETFTDPDLAEYTIKVPPPRQEKDEVQIQNFWQMFKQLHVNITLADALILMPKYQKMLKALLSNKEKLQELANTPLNKNCSAVILKRLPEKLGDPGKFLIPCSFSELKCKALADLGASINLMPLSVWKKLDIDAFNDIHPHFDDDPLSGSTTYSANSLLEEFTNELALITYPLDYDDNLQFDIESDLKEIEFLLYQGEDSSFKDSSIQTDLANLNDYFVDPIPEIFTKEHAPDYSSPPKFDVYLDDFLENESNADNFYNDLFDSEGEKIKESKLLIDELDLPCDSLPYSEFDSFKS
nr:reverse transcriptase domain-containing protein [Tanacetum cinerariifolium]